MNSLLIQVHPASISVLNSFLSRPQSRDRKTMFPNDGKFAQNLSAAVDGRRNACSSMTFRVIGLHFLASGRLMPVRDDLRTYGHPRTHA